MKPKLALMVGAIAALVFGLLLTLLPTQMLSGFGITAHTDGIVLSRDVGVTLIGLGVLNWMTRNATGAALTGILTANLLIQALELVVNGYEIIVKDLPMAAAGGLAIHVVLGLVFLLALIRPQHAV